MSIAENLHRVQERIACAAESAGRHADEIMLVGVTKYVGTEEAEQLIAAGCTNLGESRPQELWKKADELTAKRAAGFTPAVPMPPPIHWHLIGHLQRNKVPALSRYVALIHSVDSERLLAEINDACIEGCGMIADSRHIIRSEHLRRIRETRPRAGRSCATARDRVELSPRLHSRFDDDGGARRRPDRRRQKFCRTPRATRQTEIKHVPATWR